ncbi:ABC transporter ATP-binding protein [Microbacterium sp. 2MCAF23]|uniref:ABC transporter ATP-binding protein n=1 Tax=Microbacterium sp. 2MCAF23 TaxID=3232985 RepID=UPI003F97D506
MSERALLEVEGLHKTYSMSGRPKTHALNDVALSVPEGSVTGLVGESGSGKSTLIRCVMGFERPDSGTIRFDGTDMVGASRADWATFRREVQMVFQDPYSSLDPRMTVESLVGEGLRLQQPGLSRAKRRALVVEALESVGLAEEHLPRRSASFSGGQRQRIAIARAIVMRPRLLICDEPVSALDVSVQAQVVNLLKQMQRQFGLSMLFVAHDLAVVRHLCDTVAVLEHGNLVESGPTRDVFASPQAEYTRELIAASPVPDPVVQRARMAARPAV